MMYIWAFVAIAILFLIGRIIRWWNLPKVAAERAKRAKERADARTERLRIRREGKEKKPVDPNVESESRRAERIRRRREKQQQGELK